MRRVAISVLCTLFLCALGQEEASSCASEVSAAVEAVNAQLKAVKSDKDAIATEAKGCKDSYAKLYASWQAQDGEISNLKSTVNDLNAQVSSLELKLQKASTPRKLDAAGVAVALMEIAKENGQAAVKVGKEVFEELKHGKNDKLMALLISLSNTVRGAASSTYAFVKAELEEHTPEPVKQKVAEAVSKVTTLWKQQVLEAEWAQPLLAQLTRVNAEVKALVTKAFESTPALKPLADPVTIQLVTYALFALPLLVLLVLPLAMLGGSKKKSNDARSGSQSKNKKKGKRA